jgi:hypothetical protein
MRTFANNKKRWSQEGPRSPIGPWRRYQQRVDRLVLGAALRLAASMMNRVVLRHVGRSPASVD